MSMMFIFILSLVQPVFSQTDEELRIIREEITSLKKRQIAIQEDLREIKNQLTRKQAPAEFKETVIDIQGIPVKGNKNAAIALIEFSDYQ
jgi:hypothetical protein